MTMYFVFGREKEKTFKFDRIYGTTNELAGLPLVERTIRLSDNIMFGAEIKAQVYMSNNSYPVVAYVPIDGEYWKAEKISDKNDRPPV